MSVVVSSGCVNTWRRSSSSSCTGAGPLPIRRLVLTVTVAASARAIGLPRQVAEHLRDAGRREVAPAVLLEPPGRREVGDAAAETPAAFQLRPLPPERAGGDARGVSGVREAGLGLERQRAAERVEAEERIRPRHQHHAGHGVGGQRVPVHRVAERLVHPHAVLVDGQPLRQAQQRRRGEAPELHVRLERAGLRLVQVHAGERVAQLRTHVDASRARQLGAATRSGRCRERG